MDGQVGVICPHLDLGWDFLPSTIWIGGGSPKEIADWEALRKRRVGHTKQKMQTIRILSAQLQ